MQDIKIDDHFIDVNKMVELGSEVVAVVAKPTGTDSDELTRQIIENAKRLATLRASLCQNGLILKSEN